jgi:hypothetical protein
MCAAELIQRLRPYAVPGGPSVRVPHWDAAAGSGLPLPGRVLGNRAGAGTRASQVG